MHSSPLDTCKIKLEIFYNMFSGFGTAIESVAIINSGKAIVIQDLITVILLALKDVSFCLCHAEKRLCRKAQGKFRGYIFVIVWHIWKKILAWLIVLSSPGCLNYISFLHTN